MGIPDHLTCLLWKLYTDKEATVRTRHGVMDWFKIGKGVQQNYILSSCLFHLNVSDFTFTFHFHVLEKEMASHSSVLAWRIPGTGERGGLPSMGSHRVGHDWSNLAAAAEYIIRNAGLDEVQAGIKISGRNINNPRYADDTTLMVESEETLVESERGDWKSWL